MILYIALQNIDPSVASQNVPKSIASKVRDREHFTRSSLINSGSHDSSLSSQHREHHRSPIRLRRDWPSRDHVIVASSHNPFHRKRGTENVHTVIADRFWLPCLPAIIPASKRPPLTR